MVGWAFRLSTLLAYTALYWRTTVNEIWFGTEASYDFSLEALKKYDAHLVANPQAQLTAMDDDEEEERSRYLSVVDGVGIITVEGPLVDRKLGWIGQMFGITGYGDVQQALLNAVADADVRSIMLVVRSGGGHVAGCHETAQLIANVDKIKPVVTYSPSTMASAALWLGVSARKVYAGETAIVGSIGTLMVMVSRAEALKNEGIDVRVIRSGKFKALGHPTEPISDEAVAKATSQADYLADIFLGYVAERRKVGKATARGQFGEGQEFVGAQAVSAGLIDGVQSYSASFMSAKALAPADNRTKLLADNSTSPAVTADNSGHSKGTPMPNPHIPTPEQLAAMAAGVTLDEPAATTPQAVQAEDPAADAALAEVQTQLEAVTAEAAGLKAQIGDLTANAEALTAQVTALSGLAEIARASIRTMSVALSASTEGLADVAPEGLAALHAEVSEKFKAKFKGGSVAAVKPADIEVPKPAVATINPLFQSAALLRKRNL